MEGVAIAQEAEEIASENQEPKALVKLRRRASIRKSASNQSKPSRRRSSQPRRRLRPRRQRRKPVMTLARRTMTIKATVNCEMRELLDSRHRADIERLYNDPRADSTHYVSEGKDDK